MKNRKLLGEMPGDLNEALKKSGLSVKEALAIAEADMDVGCDFRRHILVLTEKSLIHGAADNLTNERVSGIVQEKQASYMDFSFTEYSISRIEKTGIDSLVVGGIFRLNIDGRETALLAFTNSYRGRMNRLRELLELVIKGEKIEEEKLYEEAREEFCPKCGVPYPDKNRKICPKCMDKRKIFFRLASYFSPYKAQVILVCLVSVLGSFLAALWPVLSGSLLYDEILGGKKNSSVLKALPINDFALLLLVLVVVMVVAKLLQQFFGIIQGRIVGSVVPRVVGNIKNTVFDTISKLSVSFFTDKQTGGLMSRVTDDATRVLDIFIDGIPQILPNLFTILFSLVFMFRENWILTITAIITLPPAIAISLRLRTVLWNYYSKDFQAARNMRARLNDNVTGARVVKAFGREKSEAEKLSLLNNVVGYTQFNSVRYLIKFTVITKTASTLSSVLTWTLGACFVLGLLKPELSYGTLMTFTGYVGLIAGPAEFISNVFRWWTSSMNSAQRIFEILDAKPEVVESLSPVRPEKIRGEICLDKVSFGYEENREVLKNINLLVEPGKMLGIVGKSGAGKSTLANLISRLYDPTVGDIYLDGINLRDMAFEDVRRSIAMVSQETYIFKGTIFDNIAYANSSADKKDVLEASIASGCHDFICKLPDGYDTAVGTGGRSLSGGEKQRISIARAILADPKILILDEATAAVDTETERRIQQSLKTLTKNRTTLSIAHRLSTLRDADELIVLEDGKITEQGTHNELVRKKGTYYKLLQIQTKALAMRGIGD